MEKVNLSEKDVKVIARRRYFVKRSRWPQAQRIIGAVVMYALVIGCAWGGVQLLGANERSTYVTASGHELRWEGKDRVLDGEIMTREPADLHWSMGVIALFILAGVGSIALVVAYLKYDKKETAQCKAFLQHWKETGEIPLA